jgi:predicted lipid-binding transport protein (Tim44 family)
VTVEMVLLAMVAVFAGLRLYAVLGRRTGHEQQPVLRPKTMAAPDGGKPQADVPADRAEPALHVFDKGAEAGLRAVAQAEPGFDAAHFLEGAQGAYRMILEAFWKGDREELAFLVDGEAREAFEQAIADREADGVTLDNRLIAIERAVIDFASVEAGAAFISVRFDADIVAVTRDRDGNVIAGSMSDAIVTHDLWTFKREIGSQDPNWKLVETDQVA